MKTIHGIIGLVCAATLTLEAQETARRVDVQSLGPQAGQRVPDFRLQDGAGKMWTLPSIMGPKGAMLVFSRSADWCPYCKTQIIELQSRVAQLKAEGLGLAVITYDSPAVLADFARRRGITFPLLSDPGSATIKAYGILNSTVEPTATHFGIPFPGTFLVDRNGVVTSRYFEDAYQDRTTVSNILLQLGSTTGADTPATRIATDHLELTTYTSDAVVAPGSLFSIVFDVVPRAGIHVYAPGAQNYKVISVMLEPNAVLTTRPLRYPRSEMYFFAPLNEHVPVFQKPFRLSMDAGIGTSKEIRTALATTRTLEIRGRLEYQACDDKVCFLPKTVPISYTLQLRQLDTERAGAPQQ